MKYLGEARARARGRKSPVNLLLIPAVMVPWFAAWWVTSLGLGKLYRWLHPAHDFTVLPEGLSGILMAVTPLFAWLTPAMVLGNLLVASIPLAKRVLDAEAAPVPGTDLMSSNRALLKIAFVLTPASLLFGLLGALVSL
jgi:hypothetical protein